MPAYVFRRYPRDRRCPVSGFENLWPRRPYGSCTAYPPANDHAQNNRHDDVTAAEVGLDQSGFTLGFCHRNSRPLYSLENPTSIVAPPRGGERDTWRAEYQHFPRGRSTSAHARSYGAARECLRSGISTWHLTPFTTSM
jgi:hypothetical protein